MEDCDEERVDSIVKGVASRLPLPAELMADMGGPSMLQIDLGRRGDPDDSPDTASIDPVVEPVLWLLDVESGRETIASKASSAPAFGHAEPTGEDWGRLQAVPRRPAVGLQRAGLPEGPGVYLWSRAGVPEYVGTAASLRKRLSTHLGAGVSLVGSSLRRNVCELLFQIPPNVTGKPTRQKVTIEQAAAIHDWLLGCEVSWL